MRALFAMMLGALVACDGAERLGTIPAATDAGPTSDLLPPARRIDWSAGVPGGIPHRTTQCANVKDPPYNAKGDGITDDAPAIQKAIDACPPDSVVFLPAGNYLLRENLIFARQRVTLRGAGPKATTLTAALTAARQTLIDMRLDDRAMAKLAIVGGAAKGSSTVTLASATGLKVGAMIVLDEDDDPDFVVSAMGQTRLLQQRALVTAIDGAKVSFTPPLFLTLDAALHPALDYYGTTLNFSGVEDLSIVHTNANANASIFLGQSYGCWIKNVESHLTPSIHFFATDSLNCEIRDSFADDAQQHGPDHGPGVDVYSSTGLKIENDVFRRCFASITLVGSSGNVIAYNYSTEVESGSDLIGGDLSDNSGPHNFMNLWEGNIGAMFQSDGAFGSSSHGTAFRNWFSASHPTLTLNRKAVSLERWSYYYNFLGNVLGSPGWPQNGQYEIEQSGYSYDVATIYRLGFPFIANNSYTGVGPPGGLDPKVKQTLYRHGNWDYANSAVLWDPTVQDHALPASLVYSTKPAFWPAAVPWPPIGPDLSPMVSKTPAQIRFEGG